MNDALSIEFADRVSGLRGWVARGYPGLGSNEAVALVFDGEEQLLAGPLGGGSLDANEAGAQCRRRIERNSLVVDVSAVTKLGHLSAGAATVELKDKALSRTSRVARRRPQRSRPRQ